MAENILRQFPRRRVPHVGETVVEHITKSGYDLADAFQFRLDLILDSLEAA